MALERRTQMAYLPLAKEKNEGASTYFDDRAGERWLYSAEMKELSLGYIITRKAVEDNQYRAEFNPSNLGLQDVFATTKEIYAANIFNTGLIFDQTVGGDQQALFSTSHPIESGVVANKPGTEVDLNESTLLTAMTTIRNTWVDERNIKIAARAELLLVPAALEPVAVRLLRTQLRPGTNDNDVNAILHVGGGLRDYQVNEFLTSNFAWFVKTDKRGLIYYDRVPFEMDMYVDFDTDNLKVKGRERYTFSYFDWRSVYGTFPTA
jgi:phage major head subunit gpT-like protein